MSARNTLYLLRRPIADPAPSLLPSSPLPSGKCSLVLLEEAVSSLPSFPGQIYVLRSPSAGPERSGEGHIISHKDLVALIAEHDVTIVL